MARYVEDEVDEVIEMMAETGSILEDTIQFMPVSHLRSSLTAFQNGCLETGIAAAHHDLGDASGARNAARGAMSNFRAVMKYASRSKA